MLLLDFQELFIKGQNLKRKHLEITLGKFIEMKVYSMNVLHQQTILARCSKEQQLKKNVFSVQCFKTMDCLI